MMLERSINYGVKVHSIMVLNQLSHNLTRDHINNLNVQFCLTCR